MEKLKHLLNKILQINGSLIICSFLSVFSFTGFGQDEIPHQREGAITTCKHDEHTTGCAFDITAILQMMEQFDGKTYAQVLEDIKREQKTLSSRSTETITAKTQQLGMVFPPLVDYPNYQRPQAKIDRIEEYLNIIYIQMLVKGGINLNDLQFENPENKAIKLCTTHLPSGDAYDSYFANLQSNTLINQYKKI